MWPDATYEFLDLPAQTQGLVPSAAQLQSQNSMAVSFSLVIPHVVAPESCLHPASDSRVQDMHRQLPPSLGVKDNTSVLNEIHDDLKGVVTNYSIQVAAVRHDSSSKNKTTITEARIPVLVQPKLQAILCSELSFNKDCKHAGHISARIFQLDTAYLPFPPSNNPVTLRLLMTLHFHPASLCAKPPTLRKFRANLKAKTTFTNSSHQKTPYEPSSGKPQDHQSKVLVSAHFSLNPSMWQEDTGKELQAEMPVALVLPQEVRLVPSFESCIVSRVYTVEVRVTFLGCKTDALDIEVPVRIEPRDTIDYSPTA